MKRPLVIGYGNPLCEDDGIGWRAAELVEQSLKPAEASVLRCHQLTPELAVEVQNASLVIFLDAALDQEPGSMSMQAITRGATIPWSHYFTPRHLLTLVENPPPAYWITCGASRMGWREGLTEEGEDYAAKVSHAALKLLQKPASPEETPPSGAQATHTTHPDPRR